MGRHNWMEASLQNSICGGSMVDRKTMMKEPIPLWAAIEFKRLEAELAELKRQYRELSKSFDRTIDREDALRARCERLEADLAACVDVRKALEVPRE